MALTLRAVGGLTTAEIAHAYGTTETTMGTRISRAKQQLARAGARFTPPTDADRDSRMAAVMQVLYLIFNEGYTASTGDELARVDLTREAIRLTRMLRDSLPDDAEVTGLLALMLLTESRRTARTRDGELVPLEEQDRTQWNPELIREGTELIDSVWGRREAAPTSCRRRSRPCTPRPRRRSRRTGRRSRRCTCGWNDSPRPRRCG